MKKRILFRGGIALFSSWALLTTGCGGSDSSDQSLPYVAFSRQQLLINQQVAVDPVTNTPIQVVHVKLGAGIGDGTYENPFDTVAEALAVATPGTIIYVQSGNNSGIQAFTVPKGVHVISSGPTQYVDTVVSQNIKLPLSGDGISPKVTGTVTLQGDTALEGFDIDPSNGPGIQAPDATGNITVADNIVRKATGGNSGILLVSNSGTTHLVVERNTVSSATRSGITIQGENASGIDADVNHNTVTNSTGTGIFFFVNHGAVTASITGNTTTGNKANAPQEGGIRFGVFNDAQGIATITGNTSNGNTGNGIFVGSQGTSRVTATISKNTVGDNQGNGIFLGSNEQSDAIGTVTENQVSGNKVNAVFAPFPSGNGIFVGSQVSGHTQATIRKNTTTGNGNIGIFYFAGNNGQQTAEISNNTSTNNTRTGIEVNVGLNGGPGVPAAPSDAPVGNATLTDNIVTDNLGIGPPLGGGGIFVLGFNKAVVNVSAQNNQILRNATETGAFAGMGVVAVQNARVFAGIRSNTFTGNGGSNTAFTALAGVPDSVLGGTLKGPAQVNLSLRNNTSDSPYTLLRLPGTSFNAETISNAGGPVLQPALPVDPLGDIKVP